LVVSGVPVLNADHTGIDLTDLRVEETRALLPTREFDFGPLRDAAKRAFGDSFQLLTLSPAELVRHDLGYAPSAVKLVPTGLRIDLKQR
jgi:hypothetical protein